MGGFLSGKFKRGQQHDRSWRRGDPDNFLNQVEFLRVDEDRGYTVVEAAESVAKKLGVTVAQVAIGWLLTKVAVTSVIIGAKTMDQLRDNLAASQLQLGPDELSVLEAASAVPAGYPYAMAAFMRAGR
jgi:aryl-alcohol dehydrogenase-like predicted oxidoreductase